MTISFSCSSCEHHLKVKDELAGRKARCPKCGDVVVVPADDADEAAAVVAAPPAKASQEQDEVAERPRKKKKKKKESKALLLLLLGLSGAVLVGVIILVIVQNLPTKERNKGSGEQVAKQDPPKQEQPKPEPKQEEQLIGKKIREEGSGLRTRINRTERLNELRQIGLFYQSFGGGVRPPSKLEDFVNSLKREAPQIAQAIQEKYYAIRLNVRSGIVAYEYDPDNFGKHGVVDTGGAARDITTEELLAMIKQN